MPIKKTATPYKTQTIKAGRISKNKRRSELSVKKTNLEDLIVNVSNQVHSHNSSTSNTFHTFTDLISEQSALQTSKDFSSLLTIDPYFAFAYWEITPKSMIDAAAKVGADAKLILRFYDICDNLDLSQTKTWDFEVFDRIGNWYLKLPSFSERLRMEIGVKSSTRSFEPIMASDARHIPARGIAASAPIKWIVDKDTNNESYTEANTETLKKTLGPYFYDLLMRGRFESITGSSVEAIFHRIEKL
jgi:hypothetical protein